MSSQSEQEAKFLAALRERADGDGASEEDIAEIAEEHGLSLMQAEKAIKRDGWRYIEHG